MKNTIYFLEYNEKIKAGFLMAPPVYFEFAFSPLFKLIPLLDSVEESQENRGDS